MRKEQDITAPKLPKPNLDQARLNLARTAAITAAVAIMAGAFGAHGVTGDPKRWLMTGGHYQLVHAVATLVALKWSERLISPALFLIGGWVFSGTLYAMALGGPRVLGAVTPLGGLTLIVAWLALAFTLRLESSEEG